MMISKDSKEYAVIAYKKSWALICKAGNVTIRFSVEKALCPDFEALQAYVAESDLF